MNFKNNWSETKERFIAWWNRDKMDRPLMRIVARKDYENEQLEPISSPQTPEDFHLNVQQKIKNLQNHCRTHTFLAEAYPSLDLNMGAGSMAVYLGCKPIFSWDTIWFRECLDDNWNQRDPIKYDPDNNWWKYHLDLISQAQEVAGEDFLVNIPDIVENMDILSAMRGPQNLCFDLFDYPDIIKNCIRQLENLYIKYYDHMYNIVKKKDGSSSYTAFNIWGPGKTAKIQCDFSALMSPAQFQDFALPSLRNQCKQLDYTIYHLDGPDAIKHLDALLKIDDLNAVQWTPGAGQPDGANEEWYSIYDKVREAGKGLWIAIGRGRVDNWIDGSRKLINRYGPNGLYLLFPVMDSAEADKLMYQTNRNWK